MGTDIVIALANDKQRNYFELRMALRSIAKNFSGHRNIYLIGERPSWVQNIIHIPQRDHWQRKQLSIYRKFLTAAQHPDVSDNFLRWDDDVYCLEPMNVSDIKNWHEGTLKDWINKGNRLNLMYLNVIKNTAAIFPDGYYYDIHAPRLFNKAKYLELQQYPWVQKELLTKSTYFNHIQSDHDHYMDDPKIVRGKFYATNVMGSDQKKWLLPLFPHPCKYETDYQTNTQTAFSLGEAQR